MGRRRVFATQLCGRGFRFLLLASLIPAFSASLSAQTPPQDSASPKAEEKPEILLLPAGTQLTLVLRNPLNLRAVAPGDPVVGEVYAPVVAGQRVVIPAGSFALGQITDVRRMGRFKRRAEILIAFQQIVLPNGYAIDLTGKKPRDSSEAPQAMAASQEHSSDHRAKVVTIVAGSTYGAVVGGLGGGAKRVLVGAGLGATLAALLAYSAPEPSPFFHRGAIIQTVLEHAIPLDARSVTFTNPGHSSLFATQYTAPPRAYRRRWPF